MPLIPQEVVDRIAGGENALRVLRKWRGKTQLHISLKTNIGQGYISDLEKGRRKGTSAALKKSQMCSRSRSISSYRVMALRSLETMPPQLPARSSPASCRARVGPSAGRNQFAG